MTTLPLDILVLSSVLGAFALLITLAIIDFKTFLLPNIYVAPFALLGPVFHFATGFSLLGPVGILAGGLAGFLTLYIIRTLANKYYGQDALGLGDVKLLGAAGLWLGAEHVMMAMTVGAFAGLVHGLIYALYLKLKGQEKISLGKLVIPAGPGFIIGILLVGGWLYKNTILGSIYNILY
ncbi:MAG: A24 family peptidase [Alphaproteobacteria bacterium]|nr:A24 family peptidase [Alphaproteobacteria bacterium]